MHFGFITAESEDRNGSVFTVRLPIVKEHITQEELKREQVILSEESNFLPTDLLNRKVELSDLKLDNDYSDTHIYLAEDNP